VARVGAREIPEGWEGEPLTPEEVDFFEMHGVDPFDRCAGCGEYWIDIYRSYGENAVIDGDWSNKKGGSICLGCSESDDYHPHGAVVIYDPSERTAVKYVVGEYNDERWDGPEGLTADELDLGPGDFDLSEMEECPLQFEWRSTDPWRGYYDPRLGDGWTRLHTDGVLHWSADAEELARFHEEMKRILWEAGVEFAVCYGTTSNLFWTNYDIYVRAPEDELKALAILIQVQQLRLRHRDPDRYARTALTSSGEDTERGRLLVRAYRMMEAGATLDEVKESILEEARAG